MWLLHQFPVSECLYFKSLCPRMGISLDQFELGVGEQGCVAQKWALVNISRKGRFVKLRQLLYDVTAPYARSCAVFPPVVWCSFCFRPFCQSPLHNTAQSLPSPWCLSWPLSLNRSGPLPSHSVSLVSSLHSVLPHVLSFVRLCLLFTPTSPVIALKRWQYLVG